MKKKNLVILIGVPGSGKSTWVKNNIKDNEAWVSRDEIRFALMSDTDEYFTHEKDVYRKFIAEIESKLTIYDKVYADATHINWASRNKLISYLHNIDDIDIDAYYFNVPEKICLERNNQRDGILRVPTDTIHSMYSHLTNPNKDLFNYHLIKTFDADGKEEKQIKIWLTSDWHFGHNREFIWKQRGYNSIGEMNDDFVRKHNEVVDADDEVFVLGDLILGEPDNIEYVKKMNGKLHIVRGNHDTDNRWVAYANLPNVVEMNNAIYFKYKKYHFYMSHFPTLTGNLQKETINQMTLNLFGHTHQQTNFYSSDDNDMFKIEIPYMYHVGVDSHEGYPVLLDIIIKEMSDKFKQCIDFMEMLHE